MSEPPPHLNRPIVPPMQSPRTYPSTGVLSTLYPMPVRRPASVATVPADMGTAVTDKTPQCSDDRLKRCIIAASTSVWGIPEMFPAQLDTVYCLLHPARPNHLAVIQRTRAGKTHILRTLGVIERGIVLILSPC